jgi:hypothetical protein
VVTGGILNPAGMFKAIPLQILEKTFPVAKNTLSELNLLKKRLLTIGPGPYFDLFQIILNRAKNHFSLWNFAL